MLKIVGIFGVDDLEEDLLHVCLVGLVLHDLAELNAVHLGRDQPLHLIEKVLLLTQDGLQGGGDLGGHESLVSCLGMAPICVIIGPPVQLLQEVVVVAKLAIKHLD